MTLFRPVCAAACVWTLALAGCSCGNKDNAPAASGSPSSSGAPAAAPKAGKELTIFGWSEYLPEAVIAGFSRETGIAINYETYASNEEMLSKLLAGGTAYDLIQPSEYTVEALKKQNRLQDYDPANVPNAKNIAADMRGFPHDPEYKTCVPYMAGTVGIVINSDKVKDPITSFKDVFSAKYKNRIVVVNDAREMLTWALAMLGIGANDVTPDTIAKARPVLGEWLKLVKVFDSDSPKTAMLNGDVDVGVMWSGEAALLYEQDKKYKFVLPDEGSHLYIDHLCIPTGAKNKVGAEMFINYVLRPDVSKQISDKFPYLNPNAEARKLLSPAQQGNPASYPPTWFAGPLGDAVPGAHASAYLLDKTKQRQSFRDIGKLSTEVDKLITDLKSAN